MEFRAIRCRHLRGALVTMLTCIGWWMVAASHALAQTSEVLLETHFIDLAAADLQIPIYAAGAPGDADAIYVVEQNRSTVRRVDLYTNEVTDFLDLVDQPIGLERGLKGLAFHPDYENNGRFFVHQYDGVNVNILEFTDEGEDLVDPATQKVVLSFQHNEIADAHTAGWIGFSPLDNYLYIPTGDGGAQCKVCGLPAQDVDDLRGKVLRIDVDSDDYPEDALRNYGIPPDNPFADAGGAPEIVALGLRSPFRAGFDRATGDLYISDVGSFLFEEINLLPADNLRVHNFGWPNREGSLDSPDFPDPPPPDVIDPLYEYPWDGAAAVIGGTVYRGGAMPMLNGYYIFADFIRGSVATFNPTGGVVSDFVDRTAEIGGLNGIIAFAEDAQGELFFVRRNSSALYKIKGFRRGDFDRNRVVDLADFEKWQLDYGTNGGSDADADGDTDGGDFLLWHRQLAFPPPDLAGYWKLDGDAHDSSGNGIDGSIQGPIFTAGRLGQALDFDGEDDYVNVGGLNISGDGLTISAQISADAFGGMFRDGRIFSKATSNQAQDHYWMLSTIRRGAQTRLRFRLKTDGITDTLIATDGNLTTDQWYHVAATYDGAFMRLFLDGSLVGSMAKTGSIDVNAAVDAWIGQNPGNYGPFDGLIDDLQIYARGLSEAEIAALSPFAVAASHVALPEPSTAWLHFVGLLPTILSRRRRV